MAPQTGIGVVDWILGLLAGYGYLIVFGFTVFENLFVVGSFTPGETFVIAASFVASQGDLWLPGVWVASVIGTIVGSNISYFLGRRTGRPTAERYAERIAQTRFGRLVNISTDAFDSTEAYFHRHGAKTVLWARFAVGAKNFVPVVAGVSKMPLFWFEAYTVLGAVLYTSLMCAIGWFLGANFDLALKVASGIGWVGLAVIVVVILLLWFASRRVRARLENGDQRGEDRADSREDEDPR